MEFLSPEEKSEVTNYLTQLYEKCSNIPIQKNNLQSEKSCDLILDFSDVFKKNIPKPKSHQKAVSNKENIIKITNSDLPVQEIVYEIPTNLKITPAELKSRKFMDSRRWLCMSRPQYSKSCGISSLISCWNYLFSTLGTGNLPPISQEEAMVFLGFQPPFNEINFTPFTGTGTLLKWFETLNRHYNVKGECGYFWKMHGECKTPEIDSNDAIKKLEFELSNENSAFIYHCYKHYCCPIGFEITPTKPYNAYKPKEEIPETELDHWLIIGEPSKVYPMFHVKKWSEISMDISNQYPDYYNMRKPEKGIMKMESKLYTTGKQLGKNPHCILIFRKISDGKIN